MTGGEVVRLQQRLAEMGFQPGPIDGVFGGLTRAAVWAYESVVEGTFYLDTTGVVTPERWLAMQDPLPVVARRPDAGKHTEIYLPEQVIVVFDGAAPGFISHISAGELEPPGDDFTKGKEWCEEVTIDPGENGNETGTEPLKKGVCGNSWTPGGVYEYYRMVSGVRESRLGGMRNPVYFNYGIAVHGAFQVPKEPASHGCIRIDNSFSEHFQSLVAVGEPVFVWDGVEEPEVYGAQSGRWDWDDPDYTTTTPPTTVAPATTVRVAATDPPTTRATTTTARRRPRPPTSTTTTTTLPPG